MSAMWINVDQIRIQEFLARDVDGAKREILNLVQRTSDGSTIYFSGWKGLGTTAVLRSIAQELQSMNDLPPRLCFGRIIYIDCSMWKSKRMMQRRIAEELKLDSNTMALFDMQDKEDDFNGVVPAYRDAIRAVGTVIHRTLMESSFIMIFLNGGDEEVVLSRMGVPDFHQSIIIWTFRRRFLEDMDVIGGPDLDTEVLLRQLRYTNIFLVSSWSMHGTSLSSSEINALVREEAASILARHPSMREDDRAVVIDCYLYVLFLHHSFHIGTNRLLTLHGANYWICDGIIQEDRVEDINKALHQEVSFECDDACFGSYTLRKKEMMLHPDSSYLVFDDDDDYPHVIIQIRPPRWISITSKNKIVDDNIRNVLQLASSIILAFESTNYPHGLPNDLIEHCSNLRVLILSYCVFSFLSPLFHHSQTLRFLGLDHCRNNSHTTKLEREGNISKWAFLYSLWVLDLRYTYWYEILSEKNMCLMYNIRELNIEGITCCNFTNQLEGKLPCLERLRIVKPLHKSQTSRETIDNNSFTDKTKLQVLDLSGNHQIKSLPTSLSKATSLHVLVLDGCYGLENVVLSNSSLKSFSFDGYGPASNLTLMDEHLEGSRPKYPSHNVDKKDIKTSFISLKGCTRLENLFLRGLPNLVELNLSGCAIKILDIETMVVHVPRLKRLFLLGCEHLCAIRWRSRAYTHKELVQKQMEHFPLDLELLYIDTRPAAGALGCTRSFIIAQPNKCFKLQVHAITADARLARSLCAPIRHGGIKSGDDVYFNIRINSSNDNGEMSKPCDEQHHMDVVATTGVYDDVFIKVGDALIPTMQAFPQPPISKFNHHIEIGEGSQNVESEVEISFTTPSLTHLMSWYVESLHVHDTSARTATAPADLECLRWCRVERCPNLDLVFPLGTCPSSNLETIWASDLLIAHCIWRDGPNQNFGFKSLRHLHLRSCPSLQYALPVWPSSFHSLETLYIIHCGNLRHVFELGEDYGYIVKGFPKLTTIHLHDVPTLQQICKVKMLAPALETIKTRGCWSLRRLPALLLEGLTTEEGLTTAPRSQLPTLWDERRRPAVEMEKDVWDALEWDGVHAGHHASLYKAPVHSSYYKRRHLRTTVLR